MKIYVLFVTNVYDFTHSEEVLPISYGSEGDALVAMKQEIAKAKEKGSLLGGWDESCAILEDSRSFKAFYDDSEMSNYWAIQVVETECPKLPQSSKDAFIEEHAKGVLNTFTDGKYTAEQLQKCIKNVNNDLMLWEDVDMAFVEAANKVLRDEEDND